MLWAFLAFFGTVFAVNGAMIYAAVSTYTGLVANEPYRKGLALQRAHRRRRAPGARSAGPRRSRSAATVMCVCVAGARTGAPCEA